MADECVSRILFAATPASRFASGRERRGAAIIPLGAESLRRSSSLPEGRNGALLRVRRIRAGPALPSYLALLHAGFSVPRMSPSERWALTPPFHPCQMRSTERGEPEVLPGACRRGANDTGGLSFCGTFRSRVPCRELALAECMQGSAPWRYQARCPAVAGSCEFTTAGVRTFLPCVPLARGEPAITRLIRHLILYAGIPDSSILK
jgi:hypothetical protein